MLQLSFLSNGLQKYNFFLFQPSNFSFFASKNPKRLYFLPLWAQKHLKTTINA